MFTAHPPAELLHIAAGMHAYRGRVVENSIKRSDTKKELQARQREWLAKVVETTQRKPSQIAADAGVSDTTLTRLLNNPEYTGTLSQVTIDRIRDRFKLPGPEEIGNAGRTALFGFAEAERLDITREKSDLAKLIQTILQGTTSIIDPWRLQTSALEAVGYMPGDIVFVDPEATPKPQDAVCAQTYDWQRGSAQTVWRVYDPPYLVGASNDRTAHKPLLLDDDRVKIMGVIVTSLRPHRLSANR